MDNNENSVLQFLKMRFLIWSSLLYNALLSYAYLVTQHGVLSQVFCETDTSKYTMPCDCIAIKSEASTHFFYR